MTENSYIYFDWNIVKTIIEEKNDPEVRGILDWLNARYSFPFSFAQLCDRQRGNAENIQQDLEFLKILSEEKMVTVFSNEDEKLQYLIEKQDIFSKYKEVRDSIPNYLIFELDNDILLDIQNTGFETYLKENPQMFLPVMFAAYNRFENYPDLYKQVRDFMSQKGLENTDNIISIIATKSRLSIEDINELSNILSKLCGHSLSQAEKMQYTYLLLDFKCSHVGEESLQDKINRKNSFSNIYNDSLHMIAASCAKCFITKDKKTLRKSQIIYDVFKIKTKVVSWDELKKNYCRKL